MDTQLEYVEWLHKLFPPQGQWREGDYFALPESTQIIELSEGRLIMHPTPSFAHQEAVNELGFALRRYVKTEGLGRAITSPFDVRLWEDKIRQPDVLFIRSENLSQIKTTYLDGPPDWVAEVISPGSRTVDEVDKLADYAKAGVPEYWLVDLEAQTIRVNVLAGDSYRLAATYEAGQTAHAETVEGFTIPVDQVMGA
jgi:Uma2 family endonuclease